MESKQRLSEENRKYPKKTENAMRKEAENTAQQLGSAGAGAIHLFKHHSHQLQLAQSGQSCLDDIAASPI